MSVSVWQNFIILFHQYARLMEQARYGVQLENGPFSRFLLDGDLWINITLGIICHPFLELYFLGGITGFYAPLWSREFPNPIINIYGLVNLKAFILPWAMLSLEVIFGSKIAPDLLEIIAGHLYYFFTVLRSLAVGRNILKPPLHKLVTRWIIGAHPANARVQPEANSSGAFRGRFYRVGG